IEPEQRAVAAPRRGLAAHAARVPFGDRPEERPVETRDHHVGGGAPRRGVGLLERVAGLEPGVIGQVPVDGDAVQPQLGGRGGAGWRSPRRSRRTRRTAGRWSCPPRTAGADRRSTAWGCRPGRARGGSRRTPDTTGCRCPYTSGNAPGGRTESPSPRAPC